jgi:hypothetical protein
MALDPKVTWAEVQAMMDAFGATFDTSGVLRIYDNTGAVPTNADDAANVNGAVLLAELNLAADAFGACSGAGVITAGTITADSSANAGGVANFARYFKTGGVTCGFQGLCALTSGGDFNIATSLTIALGANVSCSAATITMIRE